MLDEITTGRFLKKVNIQLLSNKILIRKSSLWESSENEITYDMVENRKSISTKANFGLLTIASFSLILGILYVFGSYSEISPLFFMIATLLFAIALTTKTQIVTIRCYDGNIIELHFRDKNKEEVVDFSEKIIKASNDYLYTKYSKVDKDLPTESQFEKLIFLRDRELLSDEEFEELKSKLLGRANKSNIGYNYGA